MEPPDPSFADEFNVPQEDATTVLFFMSILGGFVANFGCYLSRGGFQKFDGAALNVPSVDTPSPEERSRVLGKCDV